jgi:hypothetical protein
MFTTLIRHFSIYTVTTRAFVQSDGYTLHYTIGSDAPAIVAVAGQYQASVTIRPQASHGLRMPELAGKQKGGTLRPIHRTGKKKSSGIPTRPC